MDRSEEKSLTIPSSVTDDDKGGDGVEDLKLVLYFLKNVKP
jgi:hypothetical protein